MAPKASGIKRKAAAATEAAPGGAAAAAPAAAAAEAVATKPKTVKKKAATPAAVAAPAAAAPAAVASEAAAPAAKKPKLKKAAAAEQEDTAAAPPAAAAAPKAAAKKKKAPAAAVPAEPAAAGAAEVTPFPSDLLPALAATLRAKGITSLYPIQAHTFAPVLAGLDVVGRARTGQGKTLAFALPILQALARARQGPQAGGGGGGGAPSRGRPPSVLVLAPTRELARQVLGEFEHYGRPLGLACVCVYGGAPVADQLRALGRGVDIVVGTPGRVKDLVERGALSCAALRFRVLDEADEMLNLGFGARFWFGIGVGFEFLVS